jgi:predicted GNAT family N-acyltransferase
MFESNVPEYFAVNEIGDYVRFLESKPAGYRVYVSGKDIVGASGLLVDAGGRRGRIRWILTAASARGRGLGDRMMRDIAVRAASSKVPVIDISASQKSAPFFARYGASEVSRMAGGWGPGLDRVEMVWRP